MALCIIAWPIVYFYIPETKQVPVEEIGAMFGDEVVVHMTADGHGILEEADGLDVDGTRRTRPPTGSMYEKRLNPLGERDTGSEKIPVVHATAVDV